MTDLEELEEVLNIKIDDLLNPNLRLLKINEQGMLEIVQYP